MVCRKNSCNLGMGDLKFFPLNLFFFFSMTEASLVAEQIFSEVQVGPNQSSESSTRKEKKKPVVK